MEALFVISRKTFFDNFHERDFGIMIADKVGNGYDFLYDSVYDFKKTLRSLTITSLTSSSITPVTRLLM